MYGAVVAPAPKLPLCVLWAVCVAFAGCGDGDTRNLRLRRVVPSVDPACGAPPDARTLLVTALGDFPAAESTARSRNIGEGEDFAISSFPASTRVLAVEVIGTAGALRTVGRTTCFDIQQLDDGDELSVFMAPPRGTCPTSAPVQPRYGALAAAVGDGVVVVGGFGDGDVPVATAERYDPSTGRFTELADEIYSSSGLRGATFTPLGDGRALLAGGGEPAWQLYDADDGGFGGARFLTVARARHAAVALGGNEVMLIGGCSAVDAGGECMAGAELLTTTILDVVSEDVRAGPELGMVRIGGHAVLEADGRILLVGGVDASGAPVSDAERLDPATGARETIAGVAGIPVGLDAGSALIAFASAAAPSSVADAAVLPPGATAPSAVAAAPAGRRGASLTPLEDGKVLVVGGLDSAGPAEGLLYAPSTGSFDALEDVFSAAGSVAHRSEHVAVRLADGSVLVTGGRGPGGEVLGDAWIFRPDLTGPFTADATLSFSDPALSELIVPRDPDQTYVETSPSAELVIDSTSSAGVVPSQWAVVAGPQFVEVTATVRARLESGGMALMFSFRDPANYSLALLRPGQEATVYLINDGELIQVNDCSGDVIGADELRPASGHAEVVLTAGASLSVTVDGRPVLSCDSIAAIERGLIGVGVTGENGQVRVASINLSR